MSFWSVEVTAIGDFLLVKVYLYSAMLSCIKCLSQHLVSDQHRAFLLWQPFATEWRVQLLCLRNRRTTSLLPSGRQKTNAVSTYEWAVLINPRIWSQGEIYCWDYSFHNFVKICIALNHICYYVLMLYFIIIIGSSSKAAILSDCLHDLMPSVLILHFLFVAVRGQRFCGVLFEWISAK